MITVKLYELLRIESGIRQLQLDAKDMADVFDHLAFRGIPRKALLGCIIRIKERSGTKRSKLTDGDTVLLLPPVAGG